MGLRQTKDAILNPISRARGKRPAFLEFRSSKLFILFAVCWSIFTVSLSLSPPLLCEAVYSPVCGFLSFRMSSSTESSSLSSLSRWKTG